MRYRDSLSQKEKENEMNAHLKEIVVHKLLEIKSGHIALAFLVSVLKDIILKASAQLGVLKQPLNFRMLPTRLLSKKTTP
jgi:hypothetical protein